MIWVNDNQRILKDLQFPCVNSGPKSDQGFDHIGLKYLAKMKSSHI